MGPEWFTLPNVKERVSELLREPEFTAASRAGGTFSMMADAMELHGFTSVGEVFSLAVKAKNAEDPLGKVEMHCYSNERLENILLALPELTGEQIREMVQGKAVKTTMRFTKWRHLCDHCFIDGSWNRI